DQQAYDMLLTGAQQHYERSGYTPKDAVLKASNVVAQASADPIFAKLIAHTYDQEKMLRDDQTAAEIQAGAMAGRRGFADGIVAQVERSNVATEQAHRMGSNAGEREAASQLGLSVGETALRIAFINALSGEARWAAITQLSRATGRSEAEVVRGLESYNAAVQVGTADGANAEAASECASVYGRTSDA